MARPLRLEYEGAIYHVMARGNDRGAIFRLDRDRARFIEKLAESAKTYQVRVYAYALMPNHWHALIETPRGNLSTFMQQFNTSYTTYYNTKHQRVGHLYSGRYKAPVVEGDRYLLRLSRYIHLNPVHVKALEEVPLSEKLKKLRSYRWSSYPGYAGLARRAEWLDYGPLLSLAAVEAPTPSAAYARFVESGIDAADEELQGAMERSSKAIGEAGFCRQVELELRDLAERLGAPEDASMRRMEVGTSPEVVEAAVCATYRTTIEELSGMRKKSDARSMLMKLLVAYSGMTQRAVARRLGLTDGSGVSRAIAELNRSIERDPRIRKAYRKIEKRLANH